MTEDDIYILVESDITVTPIFAKKDATGIEEVESQKSKVESTKILRDGVIYIITPDGAVFNARGQRVE